MFRICLYDVCFACTEGSSKSSSCCLSVLPTCIQFTFLYLLLGNESKKKERKKGKPGKVGEFESGRRKAKMVKVTERSRFLARDVLP